MAGLASASAAGTSDRAAIGAQVRVPWYIWCLTAAATSNIVGVHWDISWHRTIGRDEFLTPAHILIYLCGILAGIACGYLILDTTFRSASVLRPASVRVLGFRGPLGAFIAAWGGVAMLVSAPFDDWWHNSYGLDVKVLSPPHVVLALGMISVCIGTLILILGWKNRAFAETGEPSRVLEALFIYAGGVLVCSLQLLSVEYNFRVQLHTALFYRTIALTVPVLLIGVASVSKFRWAATWVASVYTVVWLLQLWILPLFPAEPKLGPVYTPVDRFVPLDFPLLILPAAVAVDWVLPRIAGRPVWLRSVIAGLVFLGVFAALEWPFATFYVKSPLTRNWFFGAHYLGYFVHPNSRSARSEFVDFGRTAMQGWVNAGLAVVLSVLMSRLGFSWAAWMERIRR